MPFMHIFGMYLVLLLPRLVACIDDRCFISSEDLLTYMHALVVIGLLSEKCISTMHGIYRIALFLSVSLRFNLSSFPAVYTNFMNHHGTNLGVINQRRKHAP
jgi:hypothetical protein